MSYVTTIDKVPFHSLVRAAQFVRDKYNLSSTQIMSQEFEQEFNVKLPDSNILSFCDEIEFASEQDYLIFVIRWS